MAGSKLLVSVALLFAVRAGAAGSPCTTAGPPPPSSPCGTVAPTTPPTTVTTTPPATVTTTPPATVTTTPATTCASFSCPKGSDKIDEKAVCANGECSKESCCKALSSPCTTVTSTPATTVTTTPPATCVSFSCPKGSDEIDDKTVCADGECTKETCCKAMAPPCPTFTTTLATTVTTTPAPTCASFTCADGYSTNAKDTVCAKGECNKEVCCKYIPTTVTTTPPPTEPPSPCGTVVPATPPPSPCGTVAPAARKYDARMQQVGASKTEKKQFSMVAWGGQVGASWALPLLGVVAMFSFAGFVAVRVHRGQRSTSQIQSFQRVQAEDLDDALFLSEEDTVV